MNTELDLEKELFFEGEDDEELLKVELPKTTIKSIEKMNRDTAKAS